MDTTPEDYLPFNMMKPGGRWSLTRYLLAKCCGVMAGRQPDLVIGQNPDGTGDIYLKRWYLVPRNRFVNVYLHRFLRSDDDRALHDHPWVSGSLMLAGRMTEHTIAKGGIHRRRLIECGDIRLRGASFAHRLELEPGEEAITIFVTGPRMRQWGFHCVAGWRHWKDFTSGGPFRGRGCEGLEEGEA